MDNNYDRGLKKFIGKYCMIFVLYYILWTTIFLLLFGWDHSLEPEIIKQAMLAGTSIAFIASLSHIIIMMFNIKNPND